MLFKKKLPPMRRREKSDKNEEDNKINEEKSEYNSSVGVKKRGDNFNNFNNFENQNNTKNKSTPQFEFPEFLTKAENEQYLQMYIRMRQRHFTDGAVYLNVENDDIADQNLELYDNKGINLDPPLINENLANNVEYYVESLNRDQYFKVPKKLLDDEQKAEEARELAKVKYQDGIYKKQKIGEVYGKNLKTFIANIGRTTEDQIFSEFDLKLTEIINKTSNKVSLIFLFAQGLLAGVSLVNILLLYQYSNYSNFLSIYSYVVREIFNFTHALTFGSLTGNGIKFISAQKRFMYYSANIQFSQINRKTNLKRSMIFSGIIFILFTVIFAIELYLASYIPLILYSKYTSETLITETSFGLFSSLYSVCNFIAIFNFILNIFDVNVNVKDGEGADNLSSDRDSSDPEETRESSVVNI